MLAEKRDWTGNYILSDPSIYHSRTIAPGDALSAFTDGNDDMPITVFRDTQA